jgi:adenosine deaminase
MAYNDDEARKLMHQYHFDCNAYKKGEEIETVQVDEVLTKAVIFLQKQIHNLVYEKKLVIETNPTSNYLIGPFNYYDELPVFNFNNFMLYNDGKANEKNIPITICTDDQGIFRTSLVVEYDVIFELLTCNQNPLNKIATVEYEKAYQYIDYLRETSNQVSFVMNRD